MTERPTIKVYYGPWPWQFFYCDDGVIDGEPDFYATSNEEWRRHNPDGAPTISVAELYGVGIVPGTN